MMTKWTEEFIDLQKTIWRNSSASEMPSWGVHHSGSREEAVEYVANNVRNGFGLHGKDLDIWMVWFGEDTEDGLFTVAITGNGINSKNNALLIQEAFAHYNDALVEIQRLQKSITTIEAENTRLKEAMRLIPVTERMPEDHQEVLIYREGNFDTAMYHKSLPILNDDNEFVNMEGFDAGWCVYSRSKYGDFPTHWQALPEQPKEKE